MIRIKLWRIAAIRSLLFSVYIHGLFVYSVVWFISSAFCSFSYTMFIAQHFILWGANISFNLKSNMIIANMYICVYMYMLHATYIKLVCIQQPSLDHILDWRQVLLFFFRYIDDHDTCEQSFIFSSFMFYICVCMHACAHVYTYTQAYTWRSEDSSGVSVRSLHHLVSGDRT